MHSRRRSPCPGHALAAFTDVRTPPKPSLAGTAGFAVVHFRFALSRAYAPTSSAPAEPPANAVAHCFHERAAAGRSERSASK